MAVDYLLEPATFDAPKVESLRNQWRHIPEVNIRNIIAQEHQYLHFHIFVLNNLRFTSVGSACNPPYRKPIDYTLRAGAIKAAVLIGASIAEAALRAHAEHRQFEGLASQLHRRTFGNVLNAWQNNSTPHTDVAVIWNELNNLKSIRDNIHLFRAANDPNAHYKQVLQVEQQTFDKLEKVIAHLQQLQSP